MSIILQPVANRVAQEHLAKTIYNSISLDNISKYLNTHDLTNLKTLFTNNRVKVWGIKSGQASKHNKLTKGDLVLFCANKTVSSHGEVSYIVHSPHIARMLWGSDEDGETWEYIYFLDNVKNNIDIPTSVVNSSLGYSEKYNIQGFNVVSDTSKINGFYRNFDYENGILTPKDKGKTIATLKSVMDLLENNEHLNIEQIAEKLDSSTESLKPILKGGITGGLFALSPNGEYTIKK